ncbi:hypothetical protein SBA4_3090018 [Candidatus Sulfopaludibacter sp. SbA4]|nr:hypothetical protein SBA4_3090018 [Candidatus Sulfopaludibacter sp. SbA4]
MSALAEIRDRIEKTVIRIAEYEKAAARPNSPLSLVANIRALEKVQASLEREFENLAHEEELEICRYKLLPEHGQRPSISAIADAWGSYQDYFSSIYATVATRNSTKKKTARAARQESQFGFGYTFSGSIGVVLTIPAGVDFAKARDLREASELMRRMTKIQTPEALAGLAENAGAPAITKLGEWVQTHLAFGAGASVDWDIGGPPSPPLLVQVQEFKLLKQAMERATEPIKTETEHTVTGKLEGASMRNRTFEMTIDSEGEVSGNFLDAISEAQTAELPQRYEAVIRTTTSVTPSTGRSRVSHFLVKLNHKLEV